MLGETVGSYRIVAKVSEGGMGVVYRAEHTLIGRPAAVKVLLPELTTNREIVDRFFNEAKATTAVRHPGIVEIYDFGYLPSGLAFLIMEFLDGETLSQRIARRGRMSEAEAAGFLRGIAGALSSAHAKGIIHRDLKPDNIFLVADPDIPGGERPKILDFGIAKLIAPGGPPSAKTRTGALLGTPTYMSPEQCRGSGARIDHRSDLYALGCILYEMVCGRPPFVGEGFGEVIGAHLHVRPDSPRMHEPGLSGPMESLILQLLAKRPEERVQSAAELANALVVFGFGGGAGAHAGRAPSAGWQDATAMMSPLTPALTPAPTPTPAPAPPPAPLTTLGGSVQTVSLEAVDGERRGRGKGVWIAALLLIAAAGIGGGVVAMRGGGDAASVPAGAAAATPTAADSSADKGALVEAPSVGAPSVGAPSVGAPSVGAPSVANRSADDDEATEPVVASPPPSAGTSATRASATPASAGTGASSGKPDEASAARPKPKAGKPKPKASKPKPATSPIETDL